MEDSSKDGGKKHDSLKSMKQRVWMARALSLRLLISENVMDMHGMHVGSSFGPQRAEGLGTQWPLAVGPRRCCTWARNIGHAQIAEVLSASAG